MTCFLRRWRISYCSADRRLQCAMCVVEGDG